MPHAWPCVSAGTVACLQFPPSHSLFFLICQILKVLLQSEPEGRGDLLD